MDLPSFLMLLPLVIFWDGFSDGGQIVVDNFESSIAVPENSPPGTKIHEFRATVFNDVLQRATVTSVPENNFFTFTLIMTLETQDADYYKAEIFLNNHAALDYEWTPMYILTITIEALNSDRHVEYLQLFVQDVQDEQCGVHFQTQGGATVYVRETAAPLSHIYTIVSAPSYAENFIYTITDAIPASAKQQFSIDQSGSIHVPLNGFGHHNEERNFELHITVTEKTETICKGTLKIVVTPVNHWIPIFTSVSKTVSIPENQGPEYYVTKVTATGNRVHYHLATFNPSFHIGEETGIIKTSYNLDLDQKPGLAVNLLVIVAFDESYLYSSLANVTVYLMDVNDNDPQCTPPILVAEIPETTPVETILFDLTCSDPDYSNTNLSYTIVANDNSRFKFKYHANSVRVNESLDYDSAKIASLDFQYTATVIVTDDGTPPRTTTILMLVTVTQVNEFPPVFHGTKTFSVLENSPVNTQVGVVNATDADWVYNDVRFSIVGHAPPTFYIHPYTGQINNLVPLDFERIDTYTLTIQAVDMTDDVVFDSSQQRTSYAQYTIKVENVNDVPPVCIPPYYKETIYSTRADNIPIVTLSCTDKDSELLTYRIVGGKTRTPVNKVVTVLDKYWKPEAWFVVVLTLASALAVAAFALLLWNCLSRTSCSKPAFLQNEISQRLLEDRSLPEAEAQKRNKTGDFTGEKKQMVSKSPLSQMFDGRATDPSTGRHYLFNSMTGARRWV
ncbi:cadherin-related family member 4-like isoform X2 [Heterodontus francisci]|uniref:cadherin-related family member 4-like isoform X2 n=1 Tax=Heterodontus francisci TaxID=7792 RepID=UPI00355AD93F